MREKREVSVFLWGWIWLRPTYSNPAKPIESIPGEVTGKKTDAEERSEKPCKVSVLLAAAVTVK